MDREENARSFRLNCYRFGSAATVVTRNTRRIRLFLASNWPSADIYAHAMSQLRSP